ncbi:ABC transporter C member 13 [Coemansia sp. RSA 1086]|nr:ABC transporter C member 13 [Coemansia sp. RSA 1086]
MDNCKFSWGNGKFELKPPNLTIKSGEFVVVVGPVGQGKSSLLSAICGEMPIVNGKGCVYGKIGYASQSPWIMNASFRENILFGNDYDEARYNQVILACALTDDISELPGGDATEIGFKGVNLSGGQKARLALARAIYTDADIFILDDILSAVDVEVGRHIIEHVLTGSGIISSKTRILVTHAEYVVPLSDKVIVFSASDITVSDQASINYQSLFKHKAVEAPRIPDDQQNVNKCAHTLMPETDVSYSDSTLLIKFIEFSGYAVVVFSMIVQFLNAYLLYYMERKRINLLTSVNSQQYAYGFTASSSEIHITVDVALSALSQLANFPLSTPAITSDCQTLSKFMAYTECLEKEDDHFKNVELPKNWPAEGKISVHNYSMRYHQELKPVLHNLTFDIKSREKVGVVGRTGAGKSSLSQALIRLVEPDSGSIEIDGVNISTIGLHDLRSQISIVPQDPVLFEGTVRENLDPDNKYSDDEIWQALKKARIDHLMEKATGVYTPAVNIDSIADTEGPWIAGIGLNKWVEADGRNFSLGQRQLLCLCRALLWRRGILILDEATANVDSETDELMQNIIRKEFADCTVITIAHRLNTIMDSDRVLVMDQGQIVEFGKPDVLLSQKNSRFSQLVRNTEFK